MGSADQNEIKGKKLLSWIPNLEGKKNCCTTFLNNSVEAKIPMRQGIALGESGLGA